MIQEPWHWRYLLSTPLRTRWSPARMARFRDERFRWAVRHAARTMPFYRRLLDAAGVEAASIRGLADRARLPIVTRQALREAGQEAWARDVPDSARRVASTSGSSGDPLILLFHKGDRVRYHAIQMHTEFLCGWRAWHRGMTLGSQTAPPQGTVLQRLGLLRWIRVDPARPVAEWIDLYERYRPHTVHGYASALREFCVEARLRGGLRWRPRALVTGGELYPPELDDLLGETFGRMPRVLYGAVEVGRSAFACRPGGGLHVRLDSVDVEVLHEGRPAAPGQTGQVVLTSLIFTCGPTIRYCVGDLAAWDEEPCDCGLWWPKLRFLEGRGTEVIALPDGRRVPITSLGGPIGGVPGVRQYQFLRTAPSALLVRYSAAGEVPAMQGALVRIRAMLPGVDVRGQRVPRIGHTDSGKVPRYICVHGVAEACPAETT